jgi:hypothetical protein
MVEGGGVSGGYFLSFPSISFVSLLDPFSVFFFRYLLFFSSISPLLPPVFSFPLSVLFFPFPPLFSPVFFSSLTFLLFWSLSLHPFSLSNKSSSVSLF